MSDAWTDGYNMAVLGKTQTGKTSTTRELHAESPRVSIWLNGSGKDRVESVPGETVQSIDGLRRALANNSYAVELVTSDRRAMIVDLQTYLWKLADRADRDLPMQVVVDELQHVAPQSNSPDLPHRDAVRTFAKQGVKRGIKFVGITQDPTAVDKQTLRQSEYRLIFEMSNENRTSSVVRRMGLDWNAVEEGDRYTGTLHDDGGNVLERNVRASENYA